MNAGVTIPVASWNQVLQSMGSSVQASTRDVLLTLLLERGDADAADLAETLNLSVQAIRRQLRSLAEAGLTEASPNVSGPGRPSNRWRLTDQGRAQFPDGSQRFALGLLNSMRASLPEDTVRTLLNQQAEDKANRYRDRIGNGPLQQRLEQLASLRRDEGYVTICSPEDDGVSWRLQEVHCSVQRIAEEFPAVCDQELVLIRRTVPDCQVERVHWRLEGGHACGFRITPRDEEAHGS